MWHLVNYTPFAADRCFARDGAGVEHFLVAVKATFVIRGEGSLAVDEVQRPISHAPTYRGEPASSSMQLPRALEVASGE